MMDDRSFKPDFERQVPYRLLLDAESERDAPRKEVERYKRALEKVVALGERCPPEYPGCRATPDDKEPECMKCRVEWALSEAGKED